MLHGGQHAPHRDTSMRPVIFALLLGVLACSRQPPTPPAVVAELPFGSEEVQAEVAPADAAPAAADATPAAADATPVTAAGG